MGYRVPQPDMASRYLLAGPLGYGNMGTVYRATDRLTGEHVALKRVKRVVSRRVFRDSPAGEGQLALAQEFTLLSTLRHPNIVSVVDYGFAATGQPYVAMELLINARPITEAARALDFQQKTDLLVQLLQALLYLHRRGVLHCDLKPRNVLVTETAEPDGFTSRRVKVLDFGLSSLLDRPHPTAMAGTPAYMAPELWQGAAPSRASDLYAFGVICYELYAGQRPFDASHFPTLHRLVREQAPDLDTLDAPGHIRHLVGRLLAKDPRERCADASEALGVMRTAVDFALEVETLETRDSFLQAARFVGREAEMGRLLGQLRRAFDGRGSAWLVGGESGVGKSRLLDELRTLALVQGAMVARGQARREGGAPYAIWRDVVRWLCLTTPLTPDEAAVIRSAFPDCDSLLDTDVKPAPPLSPQAEQTRLLKTVEAVLRRLPAPLVILLEDLHWDAGESADLLRHLTDFVSELPLLILTSYRDDERPDLPSILPGAQVMRLERLTPDDTAELVEAMLGPVARQPSLVELLQRETEGNAYFVVETVRALAEEAGDLGRIGNRQLPTHILTGGMNGIIHRRLNRVPARARLFLHAAAVVGRELDSAVLGEVLHGISPGQSIDTLLDLCSSAAVLAFGNDGWRFTHVKLRDAVLHSLPVEQARILHERVAIAIETVYQFTTRETAATLVHHWHEAGNPEREQHYATIAGEEALHHYGYQSARAFFERAVALLDVAPRPPRQRVTLLSKLGAVQLAQGDYDAARRSHQAGLALAEAARYEWGVAYSLTSLGQIAFEKGARDEAEACFVQALATASTVRAQSVMLMALTGLAYLLCEQSDAATAVQYASLVQENPAADERTFYACMELLERLRAVLPPDTYADAVARGKGLSLRAVANSLIKD